MLQPVDNTRYESKFHEICLYFIYLPVFTFFMESKSIIYFFHLVLIFCPLLYININPQLNIYSIIKFIIEKIVSLSYYYINL